MRHHALALLAAAAAGCTVHGGLYRSSFELQLGVGGRASPPPAPAGPCGPTAGGPYWIEEGEPLAVEVRCASGAADVALAVEPLPPGAEWDAAARQLRWTPGLDQAGVWRLRLRGGAEEGAVQIGVADRFDAPDNAPIAAPRAYAAEMGLAVMHLQTGGALDRDRYRPTTVLYRGRVYKAEAKLRGRSSSDYPKRNYTLRFRGEPFDEPELGGGMTGRRRIVLITTFDDNSHLRHRLAFDVWNRLEPTVRIRHFSAVVYVDGQYQGLYVVADHVDEDLMAAHGLPRDGNLYKVVDHAGGFFGPELPPGAVEKAAGSPPEGVPGWNADLLELFGFVAQAEPARFRAELGARLELRDYRAWLATVLVALATDTLAKNAYHHRDLAGGPFRVIPWDFNASFGQEWQTLRVPATTPLDDLLGYNRLFERLLRDEELGPATRAALREALAGPLALEAIAAGLDGMAAEIAAAARRDERRWRAAYLGFPRWSHRTDFTDFEGEVDYLRRWIRARWTFLAETL